MLQAGLAVHDTECKATSRHCKQTDQQQAERDVQAVGGSGGAGGGWGGRGGPLLRKSHAACMVSESKMHVSGDLYTFRSGLMGVRARQSEASTGGVLNCRSSSTHLYFEQSWACSGEFPQWRRL